MSLGRRILRGAKDALRHLPDGAVERLRRASDHAAGHALSLMGLALELADAADHETRLRERARESELMRREGWGRRAAWTGPRGEV